MVPGIGGAEWVVIALVALIVIGPKDLPKMLRELGRFVGRMRNMADEFRSSFEDMARQSELDDLKKEVQALRSGRLAAPIVDDINASMNQINNEISQSLEGGATAETTELSPRAPELAPEPSQEPKLKPKRTRKKKTEGEGA